MSTVKIKLTDAVSNYEADDLSLKAYVKGSLVLDIKVLFMTIPAVLSAKGAA